jgi:hypothetical protein
MSDRKKSKIPKKDSKEDADRRSESDEASDEVNFQNEAGFEAESSSYDFSNEEYGEGPSSLKGAVGEGIKKLFAAGISAAFLTEESVRTYLGDVKLPKDVLKLFVEGAAKSKEQLMNRVGNEVISIIQKIDFVKEASRFVETHKFRVSAEVEVLKKDSSLSEQGRASFSVNMERKSRDDD